jgi:phytol kinase
MPTGLIIIGVLYGVAFLIGELAYHGGVDSNITRKIIHIGGGVVTAFLPFFVSFRIALLLAVFFIVFIFLSERYKYFHSIHNINWQSRGAILFPVSALISILLFWELSPMAFSGAMLVLGLSDGFASLLGRNWGRHNYFITAEKTYEGSLMFFIITLTIFSVFLITKGLIGFLPLSLALLATIFLTVIEGVSRNGWDNLFLPLVAGGFFLLLF